MESPRHSDKNAASTDGSSGRGVRHSRRSASRSRTPQAYRVCDGFTEGLLYAMIVFGPWAFGTTQYWSTWVLNVGGYLMGALLVAKWIIRWKTEFTPPRWSDISEGSEASPAATRKLVTFLRWLLVFLSFAIPVYCAISAWNARVAIDYSKEGRVVEYLKVIKWLPHSYDRSGTWYAVSRYVALAFTFWAVWDWLVGKTSRERRTDMEVGENDLYTRSGASTGFFPERLRRLFWVLSINGGLLAAESVLQRLSGTQKLLWLAQPHINKMNYAQFGPYAYRSNAAQYFNLVWPIAFGMWWVLRSRFQALAQRTARVGGSAHVVLLPLTVLMAACPVISTSRGGALISACLVLGVVVTVVAGSRSGNWRTLLVILGIVACAAGLAGYLGWSQLEQRLRWQAGTDMMSGRGNIYENSQRVIDDFPLFGTGAGSFIAVYEVYRVEHQSRWEAYLHNDWMQTRLELGIIGFVAVILALGCVLIKSVTAAKTTMPWVFSATITFALGGCFVHAIYDFPFQVYSILFLAVIQCAILYAHAGRWVRGTI